MQQLKPVKPGSRKYYQSLLKNSGQWYGKNLAAEKIPKETLELVSRELVEKYQIIPVAVVRDPETEKPMKITVVTSWHQTLKSIPEIETLVGIPLEVKLDEEENVLLGIEYHYSLEARKDDFTLSYRDMEDEREETSDDSKKDKVVNKVDTIIKRALSKGASDIHLKPGVNGTYVLMKIDGRLVNMSKEFPIEKSEKLSVVNIIKQKCTPPMETSNKLTDDDGSFMLNNGEKWVDFRVSTIPTIYGQKVVTRILDTSKVALNLDTLGFLPEDRKIINKMLLIPDGLVLVVGPVGSGKSTTIHAMLKKYNGLERNIITIENPCEYKDEFLTQIQERDAVNDKVKFVGKDALRSILRQDPEIIFYAEIRDEEDTALTLRATLTGHKIFSTLHSYDAISSIDRLRDMGVQPNTLLRQLKCIVAQRLVALNCPHCKEPYQPSEDELILLDQRQIEYVMQGTPKAGKGCNRCNNGYLGRTVLPEIIVFDNRLRELLKKEPERNAILKELRSRQEFRTMFEKGLELVRNGDVKLEELIRRLSPEEETYEP